VRRGSQFYDRKTALVAADILNDRALSFFEQQGIPLLRILTDRGTEYCGKREDHEYQLYLSLEDIDHSKTKARSPQSNGICERFHKTVLQEFYQVTFRKKVYNTLDELQADLDRWIETYNCERTHSGKYCYGKTPMQTFLDSIPLAKRKC
jgi:transposase InsO family protein